MGFISNDIYVPTKYGNVSLLRPLAPDPPCKLDILGHDSDPLSVDGAQVGILKQANKVGFTCFLESHHCGGLEPQISLKILGDLPHQPLERQLPDEQLRGLLIPPDLPKSDSTGPVPVRLLNASGSRSRLASSLSGKLLPWSFTSGGLTSSLLGSCHNDRRKSRCYVWFAMLGANDPM